MKPVNFTRNHSLERFSIAREHQFLLDDAPTESSPRPERFGEDVGNQLDSMISVEHETHSLPSVRLWVTFLVGRTQLKTALLSLVVSFRTP
jgi:hypothetical protein